MKHRSSTARVSSGPIPGRRTSMGVIASSLVLMIAAAAGCSSSNSDSSSGSNAAPTTVAIGLGGGYLSNYTPFLVAVGSGYFAQVEKEFHTQIQIKSYPTGASVAAAFFGHSIQAFVSGSAQMMSANAAGQDIEAVFNDNETLGTIIAAPAKFKSTRGTQLKAFNGGTWCTTSIASTATTAMEVAAQTAGLDWSKQQVVALGAVSAFIPAIKAGRCDLAALDSTSAGEAVTSGAAYIVDNLYSAAAIKQSGPVAAFPLMTSGSFMTAYPALGMAIVKAMLNGLLTTQQYSDDPAKLYSMMPAVFKESTTLQSYIAQWALIKDSFEVTDGTFSAATIQNSEHVAVVSNGIPSGESATKAFVNKYILAVYKELGKTPHAPAQ
jgi:NitT/TauT family transport system substrate-binding protein